MDKLRPIQLHVKVTLWEAVLTVPPELLLPVLLVGLQVGQGGLRGGQVRVGIRAPGVGRLQGLVWEGARVTI